MAFAKRNICLLAAGFLPFVWCCWPLAFVHAAGGFDMAGNRELAKAILQGTGIQGGLVVHLGSGNGRLTAALGAGNAYLVHGLDSKADNVEEARRHVRSIGLYGKVSIERYRGKRLPYVDNLVNLAVVEDAGAVSAREIQRVLAPGGVAYVKSAEGWSKTVKARPPAIDEWTHCLYDATNNAVSDDQLVAPPNQLQWVAGPKWARSHDHLASVSVAVSAAGRLYMATMDGNVICFAGK